MAEIFTLSGDPIDHEPTPNAGLVEHLEFLLTEAKAGNLRGAFVIGRFADGEIESGWNGDTYQGSLEMLGALHVASTELAAQLAYGVDDADAEMEE